MRLPPVLLALVLLAGCTQTPAVSIPGDDVSLRLVTLASGEQAAPGNPPQQSIPPLYVVHLLDTPEAYASAWGEHLATAAPTVDFHDRTVLVAQLVGTPQAGWDLAVDNVTWEGGLYHVHLTAHHPDINCPEPAQPSQVYTFAAFDRKPSSAGDDRVFATRSDFIRYCL